MKLSKLFAAMTLICSAGAQAAGGLHCYGDSFSPALTTIDFEGSRFGDLLHLAVGPEILAGLLPESELAKSPTGVSLALGLRMGSCARGNMESELVNCTSERQITSHLSFDYYERLTEVFGQRVHISRNVQVDDLHIKVILVPITTILDKPGTGAKMILSAKITTAHGTSNVQHEKILGEWTSEENRSNYNRCVFE